MNETITTAKAVEADVAMLVDVVQLAYRGGLAKVGWKNEHDLVTGPRIDRNKMRALLANNEAAVIKVMTGGDGQLAGCVLAEKHGDSVHIGMLAVHPDFQNMKLGKVLVEAAEQYGRQHFGAKTGKMFVLSQRAELLEWYRRLGYQKTGATVPFPAEEAGSRPVQEDTILLEIARPLQ